MFAIVDVYMLRAVLSQQSPAAKLATYVRNTVVTTGSEPCTELFYDKTLMQTWCSFATCLCTLHFSPSFGRFGKAPFWSCHELLFFYRTLFRHERVFVFLRARLSEASATIDREYIFPAPGTSYSGLCNQVILDCQLPAKAAPLFLSPSSPTIFSLPPHHLLFVQAPPPIVRASSRQYCRFAAACTSLHQALRRTRLKLTKNNGRHCVLRSKPWREHSV